MKSETKSLAAKDVLFLFWFKDYFQAEGLWYGRPSVMVEALTHHNVTSEWMNEWMNEISGKPEKKNRK